MADRSEFIYGRRPVWEALRANKRSLHKLWMASGMSGGIVQEIQDIAKQRGVPIEWMRRDQMDRMAQTRGGQGHHQGVIAEAGATAYLELDEFLKKLPAGPAVVVGLDEIEDPQNVGAIFRNAGFFGVAAVIMPRWRSAPVTEAVVRASSGAAEHISVIRVRNLVQAIDELKEAGFEVWGADMGGETLGKAQPGQRIALILGSEGTGMRRLVREHCDKLVSIPGGGQVQSLNVASTSAIFLHELFKPRPHPVK